MFSTILSLIEDQSEEIKTLKAEAAVNRDQISILEVDLRDAKAEASALRMRRDAFALGERQQRERAEKAELEVHQLRSVLWSSEADEIIPADIKSPGTFDQGIAAAVAFLREEAREASRMSASNGGIMETLSVYLDEIADIILTTKHSSSVESQ